jgi:putative membrane protein insertion efficiency factor
MSLVHRLRQLAAHLADAPAALLLGLIRVYRYVGSPIVGRSCRFTPSCSAYGMEAVRKHGAARGTLLTAWRIARCNPWCEGGPDPVPDDGRLFKPRCACRPASPSTASTDTGRASASTADDAASSSAAPSSTSATPNTHS